MHLNELLEKFKRGYSIGKYVLKADKVEEGRFIEEFNLKIIIQYNNMCNDLMFMKIFLGRPPHYFPWIELFNIMNKLNFGHENINFFDSDLETSLLETIFFHLPNGSHIFIEYINDETTRSELTIGVPPPFTRLGYKLLNVGFTWFKDWYFPEGQNEGNPKLQAEKPLSKRHMEHQLNEIEKEAKKFLLRAHKESSLKPARYRAEIVLNHILPRLRKFK